ncbi:amino acid/amide ABC transporter ATP-binding protein 2, HAAT family [Falsiroseomonas stagni DSM 19981]|uniref:Amino acid/amide ABC transporter ATP-binding protein 2, HAAT family n=1 Tax=Falsiroseomonas stagni DSM 19981 TaxID=1123062 RepID=A0A1I4E8K8_9PROT|nr:amino acid/amide ABC transporter ATP-binding protein 2, HAAT family [Falsiroseomonas stagni DSM 19981]
MPMLLEVEGLDVRYGRTQAVRGVSLDVAGAEVVTVLGANGAGKSSLLKAVAGAVKPAGGRVVFDGADITALSAPERVRRGLVLVPEGRQILVSLTVHENLLMGAYGRRDGDVARDIDGIYARFSNLAARRDMLASVLSGGEQQMLAISRALLARPRLMMLDEPSLGLSPLLVGRLFDLIRELNRDGLAILLVEQNTRMALRTASRGYVMELGRIVLDGPADRLADNEALAAAYLGSH